MLKWLAIVASMFVLAGIVVNIVAILLSDRSFEATSHNWSLAIRISLVGIVVTVGATLFNLWRLRSR